MSLNVHNNVPVIHPAFVFFSCAITGTHPVRGGHTPVSPPNFATNRRTTRVRSNSNSSQSTNARNVKQISQLLECEQKIKRNRHTLRRSFPPSFFHLRTKTKGSRHPPATGRVSKFRNFRQYPGTLKHNCLKYLF